MARETVRYYGITAFDSIKKNINLKFTSDAGGRPVGQVYQQTSSILTKNPQQLNSKAT